MNPPKADPGYDRPSGLEYMMATTQKPPKGWKTPQRPHMGTFWRLHHMTHSRVLRNIAAMGDIQN